MGIDRIKLLAWLYARATPDRVPLVGSIYAGLAERLRRGDFDDDRNTN